MTVFTEHPLVGIGTGTFREGVRPYLDRARAPHNLFMAVAVESGIVGLIILAAPLISALIPVVLARNRSLGLYLILFCVLLVLASVANVDTSQVVWLGLALLSLARTGAASELSSVLAEGGDSRLSAVSLYDA
jgi:O-antigen ligase